MHCCVCRLGASFCVVVERNCAGAVSKRMKVSPARYARRKALYNCECLKQALTREFVSDIDLILALLDPVQSGRVNTKT